MKTMYNLMPPKWLLWSLMLGGAIVAFPALTHASLPKVVKTADKTVTGRVTDASTNEPLAGCSVVIKGTQRGTNTDANGSYTIAVPNDNTVLVFGFIGYDKQEVPLGTKCTVFVCLNSGA